MIADEAPAHRLAEDSTAVRLKATSRRPHFSSQQKSTPPQPILAPRISACGFSRPRARVARCPADYRRRINIRRPGAIAASREPRRAAAARRCPRRRAERPVAPRRQRTHGRVTVTPPRQGKKVMMPHRGALTASVKAPASSPAIGNHQPASATQRRQDRRFKRWAIMDAGDGGDDDD